MSLPLRRLWSRRLVRLPLIAAYATGLAVHLTLGNLQTSFEETDGSLLYVVAGATGIAGLVGLAGWHTLWLLPVTTIGFAVLYENHLWNPPPGVPLGGMDYISFYPTSVIWTMPFALAFASILAAIRPHVLREKHSGRGQAPSQG